MFLNRYSENGIRQSKYYVDKSYNKSYGGPNWLPNCTSYCISRGQEAMEANDPVAFFKDRTPGGFPEAKNFYSDFKGDKGEEPKVGSFLVWGKSTDKHGHVAFCEEVLGVNDRTWKVKVSQSNYGGEFFEVKEYYVQKGKTTSGVGYVYQGACYLNIHDKRTVRNKDKFQVDVLAEMLRVRKSPNGEAYAGLYCPIGLYDIIETVENNGYTWARLDRDMWIALNDEDGWTKTYSAESESIVAELEELKKQHAALQENYNALLDEKASLEAYSARLEAEYEESKELLVKAENALNSALDKIMKIKKLCG